MKLFKVPSDVFAEITQFLSPRDFYSLRTVDPRMVNDQDYWCYNGAPISPNLIIIGARFGCLSVCRLCAPTLDPDTGNVMLFNALKYYPDKADRISYFIVDAFIKQYAARIEDLLILFVEQGKTQLFTHTLKKCDRSCMTMDTVDAIYFNNRWIMMARVFVLCPRLFIMYVFGSYTSPADPQVIKNLRIVMFYLDTADRVSLSKILQKYYMWLWTYKLDTLDSLATICEIDNLLSPMTDQTELIKRAFASKHHQFLEYLLLKGATVNRQMLAQTDDLKKLQIVWNALVVQRTILILMLLIFVIVIGILNVTNFYKIEKTKTINKHNGKRRAKTIK